jgi:uncharacterized protein YcfL
MKSLIFISLMALMFGGCSSTMQRPYIDNYSLCSQTISNVIVDKVTIDNNSKSLYVTADEIKSAFESSLVQSGCFYIYKGNDANQLLDNNTYILNLKASIYQENQTTKENLIKKENKEKLIMVFNITAHSGEKTVVLSSKSELFSNSSKILGFEKSKEYLDDKNALIQSASKQATIVLHEKLK